MKHTLFFWFHISPQVVRHNVTSHKADVRGAWLQVARASHQVAPLKRHLQILPAVQHARGQHQHRHADQRACRVREEVHSGHRKSPRARPERWRAAGRWRPGGSGAAQTRASKSERAGGAQRMGHCGGQPRLGIARLRGAARRAAQKRREERSGRGGGTRASGGGGAGGGGLGGTAASKMRPALGRSAHHHLCRGERTAAARRHPPPPPPPPPAAAAAAPQ